MATTSQDIKLDTSWEHSALTPEMRQMAAELWDIVKARVDAEGFPLRGAVLRAYTDMEEVDWVNLDVWCNTSRAEATAFGERVWPDFLRWLDQQGEEYRGLTAHPGLYFAGLPASQVNGGV